MTCKPSGKPLGPRATGTLIAGARSNVHANNGFASTEAPGASVSCKNRGGALYHTYSVFARGLDMFLTAYHYLDIVPNGRGEGGLSYTMEWVRRHDEYD